VVTLVRFLASPASEGVNGQLFIVYGPTVTLVAAPTAEKRFSAQSDAWKPADLSATLHEYFAGRDPERNFSATGLMG
jgi:3-oxoacyl-[acyl-carrier protein] reductase